MRYVDLGTLPKGKKSNSFGQKRNPIFKISLIIFLMLTIGYGAFLLFWPTTTIISKVLRAPMSALSFIRSPEGELKSTDGRTNILLLGIDKRSDVLYTYTDREGKTHRNGGFLSDTIMIASIDTTSHDLALISVPRDLWVKIPGWDGIGEQHEKVNSAYSLGDAYDYPNGFGMGLARDTISKTLDIPIHYTARIDFDGFEKAIDSVGGIDVNVENSFDDWEYPIEGKETVNCPDGTYDCRYEHIHFNTGLQHMNGSTALKFARSRHAIGPEGNDFARAKRQQKVIFAFREKALSLGTLSDLRKVDQMISSLGDTLETDLDVINFPPLNKFSQGLDVSKARTLVLDPTVKNGTLIYNPPMSEYGGAWVIAPIAGNFDEIDAYVKEFLAGSVAGSQATSSASSER
ncbi:MAG: LCP family protein [Patescibacteria group bacterium]|nr:LCP family protein [Patescibacteria group bacterium]